MQMTPQTLVSPPLADAASWTILSNHGHVLVFLSRQPDARLRDIAGAVGITERAVQRIVGDLEQAGLIEAVRVGRRNRYEIRAEQPMRHPIESHRSVAELLTLFAQ
jgi:DNA-binding MarR family transcriptional regulator